MLEFPISGVETYWWLPIVVAFFISLMTSPSGVSGAFLLLPFQVSFLNFSSPAVSPTNLFYNVIAIPTGVWRFHREKRIVWSLALVINAGSIPGLIIGALIRVKYLPDPRSFKFFVGLVLLFIASRLLFSIFKSKKEIKLPQNKEALVVTSSKLSFKKISFDFMGKNYQAAVLPLFLISLVVGAIGGIYGIGGGSLIGPILITMFGLPVHTIAGATLLSTFMSSLIGVTVYWLIAIFYSGSIMAILPDWQLGLLFGIGGALGIYIGARIQKYLPARFLKLLLTACIIVVAAKYITKFLQ